VTSLPILFQDEWLVAIDKPAGYLVHPAEDPRPDDLVAMKILRDQLEKTIHVIHRLDQPTSGVVLFALDKYPAKKLRQAFEKRRVEKSYLAVVQGHPICPSWECEIPLRKTKDTPEKAAKTTFQVLDRLPGELSVIEARPHTGRFHQIRRHLVHGGHPIVGDFRYLEEDRCHAVGEKLGIGTRMLLQAKSLNLIHPITRAPLSIEAVTDPLIVEVAKKE
jgi:tRNA pseudouridine65 synthase